MTGIPLTVLDLVPVSTGSTAGQALRNSIDLAQLAEQAGYARYWFAEHHLNPGVAGTSPAVLIATIAAATDHIRVGSGAVQLGHRTALSTVEEFGLLDALHPGRIDLGLGRSGGRPKPKAVATGPDQAAAPSSAPSPTPAPPSTGRVTDNGLLIPPTFSYEKLLSSPRFGLYKELLQQPNAESQNYTDQITVIQALLNGTYRSEQGVEAHVIPGEGADVQLWILGSSGGESAQLAGSRGLRFAANYHVSPGTVLDAVEGYRAAFQPSDDLAEPYVSVSADVVVADDDPTARELAAGYGQWVRSIRTAEGAIQFPTPTEAAHFEWSDTDRALVADRIDTQFVGSPKTVADKLEILQEATGADELIITTITHDHQDRVRSYQLLADEWSTR